MRLAKSESWPKRWRVSVMRSWNTGILARRITARRLPAGRYYAILSRQAAGRLSESLKKSDAGFAYWLCLLAVRIQLNIPVEIIRPAMVEMVRRKAAAAFLQLPAGRGRRFFNRVHPAGL